MILSYHRWPGAAQANSGGGPRPKITLLHGMGGTGALWRPIAATLEDEFDILAPDQRGHGRSQIPDSAGAREAPSYAPLAFGQDVVETLAETGFHPTWIVGHSMGVRTACAAAYRAPPGWVRGLVLVDLGLSGAAGGGLGEGLATFLKQLPPFFTDRATARAFMAARCPDPSIGQYLMAVSVTAAADGQVTFPFDRAALIETIYSARDSSVRDWVRELAQRGMPILILRGARSLVWSREDFLGEATALAAHAQVRFEEFADAGHGLPFEQRARFVQRLRDFIAAGV